MVLPEEKTAKIIEEYEKYEFLWQKSHAEYKNRHKREAAYDAIARVTNLSKEIIKEKLHSLRTIFFQNLTKAKKQRSESAIKWKYFNKLRFLNTELAESDSRDALQAAIYNLSEDALSSSMIELTSEELQPKRKKKRESDDRAKGSSTLIYTINKNEDDDFTEFVSCSIRNIRHIEICERTKKRIKRILAQALLDDEEEDEQSA